MSGRQLPQQQQKRSNSSFNVQPVKRARVQTDPNLITTTYDVSRIDEIYLKLKKFFRTTTGDKDLLKISLKMKDEIFGEKYNPQENNNNLKNFEVLLAILRYLSRTKRPYNKRRIKLLYQFLMTLEGESITNIFKSASFPRSDGTYITITDLKYFTVAKDYLRKISERFRYEEEILVDTTIFSHNNDERYMEDPAIRKYKYFVYFMCNTLVMILIDNILKKYFKKIKEKNQEKHPGKNISISRSISISSSSPKK